MIIAIHQPNTHVVMSEKNNKKAYFIKKTIKLLNLQNAEIYDKAVEENTTNIGPFDVITARALANTQKIISLSEHLLKQSGKFLLMKGTKEKVLNEVVQIDNKKYSYTIHNKNLKNLKRNILEINQK